MPAVIYQGEIMELQGRKPYGDGDCVDLVQRLTAIGHTSGWMRGPRVLDLMYLNPGTVVANFVPNGRDSWKFPSRHGYHVGFFLQFGPANFPHEQAIAFQLMDQYLGRTPPVEVRARNIPVRSHLLMPNGKPFADSEDADKYYVVYIL